jgi:hypothetical protein
MSLRLTAWLTYEGSSAALRILPRLHWIPEIQSHPASYHLTDPHLPPSVNEPPSPNPNHANLASHTNTKLPSPVPSLPLFFITDAAGGSGGSCNLALSPVCLRIGDQMQKQSLETWSTDLDLRITRFSFSTEAGSFESLTRSTGFCLVVLKQISMTEAFERFISPRTRSTDREVLIIYGYGFL